MGGVNPFVYWTSWWVFFILLSVALAIVMGITFWAVAFYDASIWLVIYFFFLANLSAFTLVWSI